MSGGAYGGFCRFDPRSGDFKYLSYRDPNLGQTLETYDGAPAFLKDLKLGEDELVKVGGGQKLVMVKVGWLNNYILEFVTVIKKRLSFCPRLKRDVVSPLPFPHHHHASSSC